jgi:hypothetical protein
MTLKNRNNMTLKNRNNMTLKNRNNYYFLTAYKYIILMVDGCRIGRKYANPALINIYQYTKISHQKIVKK